jgi:hypothetical protein
MPVSEMMEFPQDPQSGVLVESVAVGGLFSCLPCCCCFPSEACRSFNVEDKNLPVTLRAKGVSDADWNDFVEAAEDALNAKKICTPFFLLFLLAPLVIMYAVLGVFMVESVEAEAQGQGSGIFAEQKLVYYSNCFVLAYGGAVLAYIIAKAIANNKILEAAIETVGVRYLSKYKIKSVYNRGGKHRPSKILFYYDATYEVVIRNNIDEEDPNAGPLIIGPPVANKHLERNVILLGIGIFAVMVGLEAGGVVDHSIFGPI